MNDRTAQNECLTGSGWDRAIEASLIVTMLGLLVALLTGLAPHEPRAWADAAVRSEGHSMITTKAGPDEVLMVIDDRAETLLVYEVVNQSEVQLSARENLPRLFEAARGQRGRR